MSYSLSETTASFLLENAESYSDRKRIYSIVDEAAINLDNDMVAKLYDSALQKKHVDFGSIPSSKGNITKFEGYGSMEETIDCIKKLNGGSSFPELETVEKAIDNLRGLAPQFELSFKLNKEFGILTYNTMVMSCVYGVSAIISAYVDYVKSPDAQEITIDTSKGLPNRSVIDNLATFNSCCAKGNMGNILRSINTTGKESFTGASAIAIPVAIVTGLLLIIPTIRILLHYFFYTRMKVSDYLKMEAELLEFNKTSVEMNSNLTATKKKQILKKQETTAKKLMKLSDKLKVDSVEANKKADTEMKKENKAYSLGNMVPEEKTDDDDGIPGDELADVYDIL